MLATPDAAAAEANVPADNPNAIEEVVVTANKRSQSIQDVGVTANVLGAAELAERKISTLADIAQAVPGLSYSASENNTPVFTLRGVGFNEAALATYPTVSVYVDEAPLAFPVLSTQGAFDLQRIEVLKGPQGTLFGENSTGGAINYIAAKPTDHFSAGEDLSYGRFNTVEFNGFASGPLSDTLKGRVAVHVVHGDDWQQSYTRNDTLGKVESYASRGILSWTPRDSLRFNLTLTGWKDRSDPEAGQLVAIDQQVPPGAKPGVTNYPYPSYNDRTADWSSSGPSPDGSTVPFRPFSDRSLYQAMLRSDIDVAEHVTVTSLTSYTRFDQSQAVDYDGIALNDDDIPRNDGSIRSFYQELRVSNGNQAGFRWIGGGNYQESRINENDSITYLDGSTSYPGLNNIYENGYFSDTYRRDYAIFGNIEYDLASKLTVIGGARYTDNLTRTDICNNDLGDGRISALITGLGSLLTGQTLPPLTPNQCVSLTLDNVPGPHYYGRLDQDNVSWRFGLNYKPLDDTLLYASASRGYKAGSFPTISASSFKQYAPVTQESVTAYEGGIKTALLDRRLTLDAAIYYYDYDNKQIRGKELDPVFGVLNALVNVPKSHLYGAEAEARLRPVRGLDIGATVTYVQSRIDRYEGTSVIGQSENFAGSRIPFAPSWQTELDLQYRWNVGSVSPFVGGDVDSRSAATTYIGGESITIADTPTSSTAPGVTHPFEIAAYTLVNLRAGISWGDGKWQAMLWGKNVFNRYYWQNVIFAFDTGYRLPGRPAVYGATLSYNY
ncbi:MAG TPA: TonB-dependent receptor [Steroidobacteraceae bacterium]|nr:TonB-dependent receptor [Steroidobacteraceae bacterium]